MTSTRQTVKFEVAELLNARNYHSWKNDMRAVLTAEGAFKIVTRKETPPNSETSATARDFYRRADRAASMIYLSVEPTIRTVISSLPENEIDDPARVWEFLRQKYDSASLKSGRNDIINRFHTSTMKPGTSVAEYISCLLAIRQELAGTEEAISDTTVVCHLLRTVPESFAITVGVLKNKPSEEQTVDAVTAALIEEETSLARRNDQVGSNLNIAGTTRQALAARTQHGKRRGYGGYGNRKPYGRPSNSGLRCFYCTREGHKESDCWVKQEAERLKEGRSSQRPSAQTARVNFGDYPSETVVHGL
jgi:hypothetical protein